MVRTRSLRRVLPLAIPAAVYAGWVAVVHARIGAYPSEYSPMDGFLVGFRQGFPHWHPAEWAAAALLLVSGAVIARYGTGWMRAVLVVHLLFFPWMNYQVWWVWLGFGRVGTILPLLALVAWSGEVDRRRRSASEPPVATLAGAGLVSGT